VLLVLVENSGRMLSKNELMKLLWPNSVVEESNLTQQISMIRKALGESPGEDRYIVTISGRGYRFAAEVKESSEEPDPVVEDSPEPELVIESSEVQSPPPAPPEAGTGGSQPLAADPFRASSEVRDESALLTESGDDTVLATPRAKWRKEVFRAAIGLLGVGLLGVGYSVYNRQSTIGEATAGSRSLAILPFQSLREDAKSDFW
jgi:DNA-binding winged helix-turn-helix (wHTH) protein